MQINVRVIPKARINKITVEPNGDLRVHTTTAPTDGKANAAVIAALSKHFNIPKSHFELVRGGAVRDKVFVITD